MLDTRALLRGLCFVTLLSWKERCFSVLVQVHVPKLLSNCYKCLSCRSTKIRKKKKRRDAAQGQTVPWNRWSKCFIVKDSIGTVTWATWGSVEAAQRKQRGRTLCFQLGANWRLWQLDKIMKFSVFYLIDFMSHVWNKVLCSLYTSLCFLLWMHNLFTSIIFLYFSHFFEEARHCVSVKKLATTSHDCARFL